MVDQEKLEKYIKKYEEIKEGIVEVTILKDMLGRQQIKSDKKLKKLSNNISDEKSSIWFEKSQKLHNKSDYLKKEFNVSIVATALMVIFLLSSGYLVADLPLSLVSIFTAIVAIVKTIYDVKKYNKEIKKCSIANISDSELKNDKITKLDRERDKEYTKNVEIRKSIDIVNERLNTFAGLKIDVENLIICLFSNLDNIIKNKSDEKNPFATWLDISYVNNEPKLEISSTMKRVRYKKEEK